MMLAHVSAGGRLHADIARTGDGLEGSEWPHRKRSWLYSEGVGNLLTTRTVVMLWILAAWLTAGAVWAAAGLSPGMTQSKLIGEILAAIFVTGFGGWATAFRLRRNQGTETADS